MNDEEMFFIINEIDEKYVDSASEVLKQYNEMSNSDFVCVTTKNYSAWKQIAAVIVCTFAVLAGTVALTIGIGRTLNAQTSGVESNQGISDSENSNGINDKINCEIMPYKGYDDSNFTMLNSCYTINGGYLYLFNEGEDSGTPESNDLRKKIRLNLKNDDIEPLCKNPDCTHLTEDCICNKNIRCIRGNGDELLYISENKLMSYKDGISREIFSNPYNLLMAETDIYGLSGFVIGEKYLYMFGGNIVFRLSKDDYKAGKPIYAGKNKIYSMCVYNDTAFVSNDLGELYKIDFATENVKKICDKSFNPTIYGDMLYYINWENDIPYLCCRDINGENEQKVLKDCYINFVIKDGYVFYSQPKNFKLYAYSLSEKKNILLSENNIFWKIISYPNIDRIFAVVPDNILSWKKDGSDFVKLGY